MKKNSKHLRFTKAFSGRRIKVKGGVFGHPAQRGSSGQSKSGRKKRSRKRY